MSTIRGIGILLAFGFVSGCVAVADDWKDESGKGYEERDDDRKEHRKHEGGQDSYFHEHGYMRLSIPEGHYPPPGECRAWFPDRPPGQQPPPIRCGDRIPPGAWLIEHPPEMRDRVRATVYDPRGMGSVQAVGEFDIGSGAFVRVLFSN